jgi:membrane protease YdiL (CAAX protease family)
MIAGIYVFPVVLLATGVIPFQWRFHVLVLMTLVAVGLALPRHSAVSLGLTMPRLRSLLAWSILPSLILIVLAVLSDLGHRTFNPARLAFYLFFAFVSAPAQEFLYRAFLFAELRAIQTPPKAIVLLSTVLFGFMHIIYRNPATVVLTLVVGLIWAVMFHATRQVCIVAVSHAALGIAAILFGVI